jgi:flavin-dependent dehydrogenase
MKSMKSRDRSVYGYDAIVVGARVAGPAVAMLLARGGLRVLMVDRRQPGGDTLSTHALMRAGVLQLHRWGLLDQLKDAGTPTVQQAIIHYGDETERVNIKPRSGIDGLYAPRRTVLDPILVGAAADAGVEIRFGVSVSDLLKDKEGKVLGISARDSEGNDFEARAPITIGADGIRSLVARQAGAGIYLQGKSATAVIYSFWSGDVAEGYDWFYRPGLSAGLIPTNDGQFNVWVGTTKERFMSELRFDLESSFHRLIAEAAPEAVARLETANRTSRFYGFPGISGFMRDAQGPGWALLGDASHFKDPISAHGITDALRDAEFLANAILAVSRGETNETEALGGYQQVRDELSTALHEASDRVASYDWTLTELRGLLMAMSKSMKIEVEALMALDTAKSMSARSMSAA